MLYRISNAVFSAGITNGQKGNYRGELQFQGNNIAKVLVSATFVTY